MILLLILTTLIVTISVGVVVVDGGTFISHPSSSKCYHQFTSKHWDLKTKHTCWKQQQQQPFHHHFSKRPIVPPLFESVNNDDSNNDTIDAGATTTTTTTTTATANDNDDDSSSNNILPPNGSNEYYIQLTKRFVQESDCMDSTMIADDDTNIFRYIHPKLQFALNKMDYMAAMTYFNLRYTFPNLDYQSYDYRYVSDIENQINGPNTITIRCTCRMIGTMTNELRLRNNVILAPTGRSMECPPEVISVTYDTTTQQIIKLCTGFVIDPYIGNTNGQIGVEAASIIAGETISIWELYSPLRMIQNIFGRPITKKMKSSSTMSDISSTITTTSSISDIPTFPISVLIQLCKGIIATKMAYYDPTLLSNDFIYYTPYVGPIIKKTFLQQYALQQEFLQDSIINDNLYNYRVDPYEPFRVWVDSIPTSTSDDQQYIGHPQCMSFTFNMDGYCTRITSQTIVDPSIGMGGGLGGYYGYQYAMKQNIFLGYIHRPLPEVWERLRLRLLYPITGINVDEYILPKPKVISFPFQNNNSNIPSNQPKRTIPTTKQDTNTSINESASQTIRSPLERIMKPNTVTLQQQSINKVVVAPPKIVPPKVAPPKVPPPKSVLPKVTPPKESTNEILKRLESIKELSKSIPIIPPLSTLSSKSNTQSSSSMDNTSSNTLQRQKLEKAKRDAAIRAMALKKKQQQQEIEQKKFQQRLAAIALEQKKKREMNTKIVMKAKLAAAASSSSSTSNSNNIFSNIMIPKGISSSSSRPAPSRPVPSRSSPSQSVFSKSNSINQKKQTKDGNDDKDAPVLKGLARATFSLLGLGKSELDELPLSKQPTMKKINNKPIPVNIPKLSRWRLNPIDNTITGLVSNSRNFDSGSRITTSPITSSSTIVSGEIVKTGSGSRYYLE